MSELKSKAQDAIQDQLDADNIMRELQSSLTAKQVSLIAIRHTRVLTGLFIYRYGDIQQMKVLAFACEAAPLVNVLSSLHQWFTGLANNKMRHTVDCLNAFVQHVAAHKTSKPHYSRCGASYPTRNFACTTCGTTGKF